jgi:uncharacterized protein YggE
MFGTNYTLIDSILLLAFNHNRKVLSTITFFLLTSFLCMSITFQDISVVAQSTPSDASSNNITDTANENSTVFATGSALSRLTPDRVFISVGVETTDKTANDALSLNSDLMNNIISELRNAGLKPNETSTTFFNIFPLYNYTESGTRLNVTGFTVTNTLQIESSNLDSVSQWVDTAVASGANSINSIDFSVTEKKLEDTRTKLITDAIGNAKQKAEAAASAVQLSITGVKSIVVDGSTISPPPPPQPFYRESISAQGGTTTSSTPIIPGEQEVSVTVSGIFSMG